MGLIQTAIMSGVGIYGISKLAKTADHRFDSRNPNPNNGQYAPQDPREFPGSYNSGPPRGPPQGPREDAYYGEYPEQQRREQWYPPQGQQRGFVSGDSDEGRYNDGEYAYRERQQFNGPPAYNQQGYQQQMPYEQRGRAPQSGLAGGLAQLAPMAMEFVQQKGDGKNGNKSGKGSEMISEFFRK